MYIYIIFPKINNKNNKMAAAFYEQKHPQYQDQFQDKHAGHSGNITGDSFSSYPWRKLDSESNN
jgi:hypothetical protein